MIKILINLDRSLLLYFNHSNCEVHFVICWIYVEGDKSGKHDYNGNKLGTL